MKVELIDFSLAILTIWKQDDLVELLRQEGGKHKALGEQVPGLHFFRLCPCMPGSPELPGHGHCLCHY